MRGNMKTLLTALLLILLISSSAFADGEIIKELPNVRGKGSMDVQKICIDGMLFYRFKDYDSSSVVQVFVPVDNDVMTSQYASYRNKIRTSVPAKCN